jgi:hypothetical protein
VATINKYSTLDYGMSQYSKKYLLRKVKYPEDLYRFDSIKSYEDIEHEIDLLEKTIIEDKYSLQELHKYADRKGKTIYKVSNYRDLLVLRKIDYDLRKSYKIKFTSRNMIVRQLKSLLSENVPMTIIKIDIQSLFENVYYKTTLYKIKDDGLISYDDCIVLSTLYGHLQNYQYHGLPRGICVSSTLAEIELRKLDAFIATLNEVYYSARYVDDIIIIAFDKDNILDRIKDYLNSLHLSVNTDKFTIIYKQNRRNGLNSIINKLDFLGYSFDIPNQTSSSNQKIEVGIEKRKINKIKTKIINALLDFRKNNDYTKLKDRLLFLTSNFTVKIRINVKNLMAGIYYNYQLLEGESSINQLRALDRFMTRAIHSNSSSFGLLNKLSLEQKTELSKYSFYMGFKSKRKQDLTSADINRITEGWR